MKVGKITAAIVALTLGGVIIGTATTATVTQATAATTHTAPSTPVGTDSGMPYD